MPPPSDAGIATAITPGGEYLTGNSVGPAPGGIPRARGKGPFWLWGAVVPIALLVLWQVIASSGVIPVYRLPRPIDVFNATIDLAQRGVLFPDIAISTQRVLLGFLFGSIFGLVVGSLVGLSRWASALLAPTIGAFRAVPSLAWLPLLVLYLGIGEDEKVLLITIGAFFPVYTTVAGALGHVDSHLVEVGRAYGLSGVRLLARVQLPAIIPSVVSGLRLALAQSWLFLVAAELIAAQFGLGFLLKDSQDNGRIDRLFAAIILLGILGKVTDSLVGLLERYLVRRRT
ncbi:MAG: binding-protein-dependent transport system inner rane component [Microbacteriaceae bacterium]|nr:binding-protein-dependent transport system inner rane component [Microbacteriaceae bacterium]